MNPKPDIAVKLSAMAEQVYELPEPPGATRWWPLRYWSDWGWLSEHADKPHWRVTVCGSDDWTDWGRNLVAVPWYFSGLGLVHASFGRAAAELWRQALVHLVNAAVVPDAVWFAGHSRGGTIAMGMAWLYAQSGGKARAVTFGAPRLWWRGQRRQCNWAAHFAGTRDPVPYVPRATCGKLPGNRISLTGVEHPMAGYVQAVATWAERATDESK